MEPVTTHRREPTIPPRWVWICTRLVYLVTMYWVSGAGFTAPMASRPRHTYVLALTLPLPFSYKQSLVPLASFAVHSAILGLSESATSGAHGRFRLLRSIFSTFGTAGMMLAGTVGLPCSASTSMSLLTSDQ